MLRFRSFHNTDPPVYTALWRQAGQPGLARQVSVDLFEQLVFGKLYFEYPGLIFACDDDRPLGFVHAAFGPDDRQAWVASDVGVIALLVVADGAPQEVAAGLLERAELRLRGRGARVIYGGGLQPFAPFYMGLYGGAELPGVLDADATFQNALRSAGYAEHRRVTVFRCELADFRAPVDRQQLQFRRRMLVQVIVDPPLGTRWQAATCGDFDLLRFELVSRTGGPPAAWCLVRDMSLSDGSLTNRTAGIVHLEVDPSQRRQGLATFLLSEAFRLLVGQGFGTVEAHAPEDNAPASKLFEKLRFAPAATGTVFRKG